MPSVFYTLLHPPEIALSFLLIECITTKLEALPEDQREDPERFVVLVAEAITQTHNTTATQEQLESLMLRLRESAEKASKSAKTKLPPTEGFASGYLKWVQEMTPVDTCLMAANFDLQEALRLYREADKNEVATLAELGVRRDWEHIKVGFEACVYAFGGGFDKESGGSQATSRGEVVVHDMTVDNPKGMAALKKLF